MNGKSVMQWRRGVAAGLLLVLALVPTLARAATRTPETTTGTQTKGNPMTTAGNRFAFKMFAQLAGGGPAGGGELKNVFISPPSIWLALTMAWNGAAGPTREAMTRALELQGLEPAAINQGMQALADELTSPSQSVQISLANSLWYRQGIRVKAGYLDLIRQFYAGQSGAGRVEGLDFASPAALKTINGWVNEQTKGKISSIIDKLEPNDALVLLNAVYFKGRWQHLFDEKRTKPMPFKLAGAREGGVGEVKNVPMMSQSEKVPYLKGEGFQVASLPYGDGRFAMVIVLPDEGQDLKAFLAKLTPDAWEEWMDRMTEQDGLVMLPRFRIEYEAGLNDPLKRLDMAVAFSDQADFSGMITPPPTAKITEVRHKSFVEVNEEGTEAAAATSIKIGLTSVRAQPFHLMADHPFVYAIRDTRTGAILFMGLLMEP